MLPEAGYPKDGLVSARKRHLACRYPRLGSGAGGLLSCQNLTKSKVLRRATRVGRGDEWASEVGGRAARRECPLLDQQGEQAVEGC